MTKIILATGNAVGFPNGTALEIFSFADAGVGQFFALADPTDPTKLATVTAAGALKTDPSATTQPISTSAGRILATEITRPANVTPYTAGDVIGTASTGVTSFAGATRLPSSMGYLVGLLAFTDQKTCVWQVRVHLFSSSPTAIVDNAVFNSLYADTGAYLGYVDLPSFQPTLDTTTSTAAYTQDMEIRKPFISDGSSILYAVMEVRTQTPVAPANAQKFQLVGFFEKG